MQRCLRAKGARCRCACGGANHGKEAAEVLEAGAPEQIPLDERDSTAYPDDATDVWWCPEHGEWTVPSRPHKPKCPQCGVSGWWRRFAPAPAKKESAEGLEALRDVEEQLAGADAAMLAWNRIFGVGQ